MRVRRSSVMLSARIQRGPGILLNASLARQQRTIRVTQEAVLLTSPPRPPFSLLKSEGQAQSEFTKAQLSSWLLENSLGRECAQLFLTL